jgi:2-epi-5-epi-valiolone 7-kinase
VQVHEWLGDALGKHDVTAQRVLGAVVAPIAELIRALWCLDPHLDLLGIGGGVVKGLAPFYAAELHQQLDSGGTCYANRGYTTAWVRDHLQLCEKGQIDCLRGAERMRDDFLRVAV